MNDRSESTSRPSSAVFLELHILVIPRELWRDSLCSAENDVKMDAISAGFIRFPPDINMFDLRDEIEQQLDDDIIPKKFVFLKSIGSRFTRLKSKQEFTYKAKQFAEPRAASSELYILESSADFLPSGASSDRSSLSTNRRYNGMHSQPGDEYLPPLSATPPPHPHSPDSKHRSANNSHDSGIHEPNHQLERRNMEELVRRQREEQERLEQEQLEEERQRRAAEDLERRRREIEEAEARRQKEIEEENERRRKEAEEAEAERKRRWEEDERRRREEEKRKWEDDRKREEERKRREEESRREEEERRRKEEEMRRAEEERKREEEEERLRRELEESRYPSPPPLQKDNKESLTAELSQAKADRRDIEKRREDLVRKAKQLQTKAAHRRNQARDIWKKKYFEEKKKTAPIEEQCNKLRQELETLHRKLVSQLEGSKDPNKRTPRNPSQQSTQKVAATKLQHEIDEYSRRVENVKMKLTAEMKLRNQAETELRALRAELTQKKINVTLTRSQQLNALGSSQDMYRSYTPMITPRDV